MRLGGGVRSRDPSQRLVRQSFTKLVMHCE